MTNQDLTNIKETIEWLLENGDFKDTETSYNSAMNSIDTLEKAILVTRCSTQLPDELQPVLAKIKYTNSLGTSNYWEVVYYNNKNWHSFQGSKTFEDGEKVVKWEYCKAIV